MIQAFVGLVGGGKSYNSVRRMMSYMAKGGRVCSNILLDGWQPETQRFASSSNVLPFLRSLGWEYQSGQYTYVPFDTMVENPYWFKSIPAGTDRDHRTLCVIDEATDLFDSLDGSKLRGDIAYRELFRFLRLSRHAHIDVLFICQDIQSINVRLRGLVAGIWRSTDMEGFKLKGIPVPFPFATFLLQLFDRSGRNLIQREWVGKDPRVFTLYQSESFGGALGVKWADTAIEDGTIKPKEGDKMTRLEKIAFGVPLALCLALSLYCAFRGDAVISSPVVVTNEVVRVTSVPTIPFSASSSPSNPPSTSVRSPSTNEYHYSTYRFHCTPYVRWIEFGGRDIRIGSPCPFGKVVSIGEHYSICQRDEGGFTFLLPQSQQSDSGAL